MPCIRAQSNGKLHKSFATKCQAKFSNFSLLCFCFSFVTMLAINFVANEKHAQFLCSFVVSGPRHTFRTLETRLLYTRPFFYRCSGRKCIFTLFPHRHNTHYQWTKSYNYGLSRTNTQSLPNRKIATRKSSNSNTFRHTETRHAYNLRLWNKKTGENIAYPLYICRYIPIFFTYIPTYSTESNTPNVI